MKDCVSLKERRLQRARSQTRLQRNPAQVQSELVEIVLRSFSELIADVVTMNPKASQVTERVSFRMLRLCPAVRDFLNFRTLDTACT